MDFRTNQKCDLLRRNYIYPSGINLVRPEISRDKCTNTTFTPDTVSSNINGLSQDNLYLEHLQLIERSLTC